MTTTTEYIIQRTREHEAKGHTIAFDIWKDTTKVSDRQQLSADELQNLLSAHPDAKNIRVRMFWVYTKSGTMRPDGEYLVEQTPTQASPAQPAPAMNGLEDEPEGFDQEEFEEDGPLLPVKSMKKAGGLSLRLDSKNPMSWMLHEKMSQLEEIKAEYTALKAETRVLQKENEKLEREIIKKDHEIEMIRGEMESGKGLNGFMSSDAGVKMVEVLGPSLVGLLGGVMNGPQIPGVLGDIADWMSTISADDQAKVREIMTVIATKHQVQPEFLELLRQQMDIVRQQMEANGTIISKAS